MSADELILWLREYTATRINSHLIDERRCIPPHVVLDFGNHGLLGLRVPRRYGGLELTQTDSVRVLQQLGGIDLTLATFLSTHANGVHTIQKYGCAALQEELLPKFASGREISAFALTEPCAGSNPEAIETQAVKHGQAGWVLNGEKYLVDSGSWASVITVFARTSGKEEKTSNLSAFAVRQGTPGLVMGGESLTMGLRGMIQNTLALRDAHVAPESLLGVVGAGNGIIQDTLSLARLNLAAKSMGGIKRCLQLMYRYASRRLISTGILWDNPVTRLRVTELVSAATAVEALVCRMAGALDAGEDVPTEAFLACKVAGTEYLYKAADTLVQVLGGRGYVETNVAPQILRDARSFLISEGPTETLLMYLGSRLLAAGSDLERFIAFRLGAPHIADQLREIADQVRARCSQQAAAEQVGQLNRSYWASWLMGEVAMWAILVAAVENRAVRGHALAHAWALSHLDERVSALTKNTLEELATGSGRAAEDLIASYAESIGDVEQSLPPTDQKLDLFLVKKKSASVPADHIAVDFQEYPKDACIHQLFERQVARTPERLAVACAGESLSYRELNARADRLARKLRQNGVRRGALVGLCVDRSLDLLVSLLGILKAGGAYVPLEPTHPRRRLAQILDETGMSVIVAHPHLAVMLPEHAANIVSPEAGNEVERIQQEEIHAGASEDQRAYVMYTSGSTGRPKGVEVHHRSVVNLLYAMRTQPGFSENDVLVAVTTISFDIAGLELLLPIVTGGRAVIATDQTRLDGIALAKLIDECGATVLQATPATWQMLLESGWLGRGTLKALCGGESLSRELARSLQTRTASLWNLYGPTETTIWSCIEKVTDESGPMSIGRPIANTQVYILNEDFEPVRAGASGEIFIGGDGVAQGYWRRPDLTAERFSQDPFLPGRRMYRTGDLGRFFPDGRIEYLGRLDHQVKIRGFRVELGEIEAALETHENVRQVVVVARSYAPGDTRLVAYMTLSPGSPEDALIRELERHVRDRVPAYMVPSALVVLDSFPLTPNGKIDRNALPAQSEDVIDERHEERPAASIEEEVKRIWSKLLRISTLDREDDFFVLGGHSLLATQVVSQLRQSFGVEIPIATMFERPTVAALTHAVCDALAIAEQIISPTKKRLGPYQEMELSSGQQRLWFLNQLDPSSAQYHVPVAFRLIGSLQVEMLQRVFQQLIERHDALRARFESRDGRPFQVIDPAGSWSLPVVDLESIPAEQKDAELERLMWQEATRPFALSRGSLLRTMLLRLAPDEHVLLMTAHHIVADGWSMELLLRELGLSYAAMAEGRSSPLLPLSLRYADCLVKQDRSLQGTAIEPDLAFWRKQLADLPVLDLPTDRSRPPEESDRGATQSFALSPELSQALLRIGQTQGATTFITLMAALQALLWRYTGQDDFGIGFPIANRVRAEAETLVGCFVNTLVLRADLSGDPTFTQLLTQVRTHALQAYAHQAVPYDLQVQEFHRPLFRVMLALQNAPAANLTLPRIRIVPMEVTTKTAKFDLAFSLREVEGKLLGHVEYSTDLFESFTIDRMIGHFQDMLNGIVTNPDLRISEIPILTDAEKHQLLVQWNDTKSDYPRNKCVHELFETQVEKTPDAIAMVFQDQQLTYREVNRRANQLAHYLRKRNVGAEVRVGICVDRSIKMIVALLGVLKAGGAYIAIEPSYPAERREFMLADSQATVLLTQESVAQDGGWKIEHSHAQSAIVDPRPGLFCLDRDWSAIEKESGENLEIELKADNLAYVIYTSGSTGQPKGVAIEHRNTVAFLSWAHHTFSRQDLSGVLASTSICFDLSVFEIFAPLTCGGTVIMAENALALATISTRSKVSLLNTVPSAINELLRLGAVPASVRVINLAGEPLRTDLVRRIYESTEAGKVHDLYGPSECTTYSTWTCRSADGPQTIGRPIANTQVYILDDRRHAVPIGVVGEIYIGGDGVARGYLNRPELTAERFINHSFDGAPGRRLYRTGDLARYLPDGKIEFLGRIDNQVKIRGYRIELGEIESVLGQHPAIQEAVVLAREDSPGERRLVAYSVARGGDAPSAHDLRGFLQHKLPEFMVPSVFMFLDALPLTPNGKLDRKALPVPDQRRPELEAAFVPPRNALEELLVNLWSEVLRVERIGVHDNFFELGGYSLLATQVISRIRGALQVEMPLRTFFETPTVAGFAERIEKTVRQEPGQAVTQIVPVARDQEIPLSFAQRRLWFLDQLEPGSAVYNIPNGMRLAGVLDVSALEQSLQEIVNRHEALRTTVATVDGKPVQVIAATLKLTLAVVDLSDTAAAEREAQARRFAEKEGRRPFDLSRGPLFRACLLRLAHDNQILLLTLHHIVADGWSMEVLYRELSALYEAFSTGKPSPLAPLPIQYGDFAIWQKQWLQGETLASQLGYWRQQLAEVPLLQFPTDRPRPALQSYRGERLSIALSEQLTDRLKALSRKQNATMYMTLLAAFQTLIHRYTGEVDIVVGSPIANRNRHELETLIGFFINTLVVRCDLSGNPTFAQLLPRVREVALGAYAHQDLPFEKLVEELQPERDLSRTPFFQVFFNMLQFDTGVLHLAGLEITPIATGGAESKFDLTMYVIEEGPTIRLTVDYNADLFESKTIGAMLSYYDTLLHGIVENPDRPISSYALLSKEQRGRVANRGNPRAPGGAFVEFTKTAIEQSICARFEQQARSFPTKLAVRSRAHRWSYAELNRQANRIAHTVRRHCGHGGQRVALLFDHGAPMIAAMLGVLKSANAYVPLDPSHPQDRIAFMGEDCQAAMLVTDSENYPQALSFGNENRPVVNVDEIDVAVSTEDPAVAVSPDALAYILYTSGSTGQPKGVMQNHRNVLHHIRCYTNNLHIAADDKLTLLSSYGFDAAVMDILAAVLNGATLYPLDLKAQDSAAVRRSMIEEAVTVYHSTPTVYRYLFTGLNNRNDLAALRLVVLGGEEAQSADFELFKTHSSKECVLVNGLGPTESTLALQYFMTHESQLAGHRLPVGYPVDDTEVVLIDEAGCDAEVYGEIGIRSAHVALGYWQRPELSEAAFRVDAQGGLRRLYRTGDIGRLLPDGSIGFLGRRDFQVKVRGFRIELGEIETALGQHPAVRSSVVLVREDRAGEKQLTGYVVGDNCVPAASDLRAHLKAKLPDYMVPSAFVVLEHLPLTRNGKIDRNALPAADRGKAELADAFVAPRTAVEEGLASIWAEVLKLDRVGIHDNLFHLGGHSLLAMQLISRIRSRFNIDVPLRDIFEAPTIAAFARRLESYGTNNQASRRTAITRDARNKYKATRST